MNKDNQIQSFTTNGSTFEQKTQTIMKTYKGCKQYVGSKVSHIPMRFQTVYNYNEKSLTIVKVAEEYLQQGQAEKEYTIGEDGKRIVSTQAGFREDSLLEICDEIRDYSTHGYRIQGSEAQKEFQKVSIDVYTEFGGKKILKGSIKNGIWNKVKSN